MIHKVNYLTSIGKYRNYTASGQVDFQKMTLIFGDNGGGKTTLTSILRSLTLNQADLVKNRKSTNSTENQAAQIISRNTTDTTHTFHHANGWSAPLNDIEIFDVHFVHDNVYSGFEMSDDHKKQLHKFVIGAQGIVTQQLIDQNKTDKAAIRISQGEISNQLIQEVQNGLTPTLVNSFVGIQPTEGENIIDRVAVSERKFTHANANAVIQTLHPLNPISVIQTGINFPSLISDLGSTTQLIQERALQELFANHYSELEGNSLQSPENWLQSGFNYVKSKLTASHGEVACPFCKQDIQSTSDILKAYTLKFNEEFNQLIERLKSQIATIENFNVELCLQSVSSIVGQNVSKIESWGRYLPNTVIAPTYNVTDQHVFSERHAALLDAVRRKLQNPSQAISTDAATNFRASGESINTNIRRYNQVASNYNSAIVAFKSTIPTVQNAQAELQRLKRIQKRFETEINTLCGTYLTSGIRLRALEAEYTRLSTQQETENSTFFSSYKDRINHYLANVFLTPFKIEDVRHIAPTGRGTQSKIGYKLTIDGKDISVDADPPLSTKECLSEGDKSTIALAFFLAKLDIDANKANKILVFDDPLSSLDSTRRSHTVSLIHKLFREMKQVIVLSHSEYFLHEIYAICPRRETKTLRISMANLVTKESVIQTCDLDELAKSDYFKQIDRLENFRTSPNLDMKEGIFASLRTVLESHLTFKFYREVKTMTGLKTFGNLINHLETSPAVFIDNANRVDIINQLNQINNIGWRPHHGTAMPEQNSLLYNPYTITLPELDALIVITLNLIYNRL